MLLFLRKAPLGASVGFSSHPHPPAHDGDEGDTTEEWQVVSWGITIHPTLSGSEQRAGSACSSVSPAHGETEAGRCAAAAPAIQQCSRVRTQEPRHPDGTQTVTTHPCSLLIPAHSRGGMEETCPNPGSVGAQTPSAPQLSTPAYCALPMLENHSSQIQRGRGSIAPQLPNPQVSG